MVELNSKPWWKSKTIWYNVAITLVATANEMAPVVDILDPTVADTIRPFLIMALAVGNTVLRVVTTKPVTR